MTYVGVDWQPVQLSVILARFMLRSKDAGIQRKQTVCNLPIIRLAYGGSFVFRRTFLERWARKQALERLILLHEHSRAARERIFVVYIPMVAITTVRSVNVDWISSISLHPV